MLERAPADGSLKTGLCLF